MVGIVDSYKYVPRYRLRRDLIAEQWGKKSLGGVKAVANFDEDALTLAFEAVWPLIERDEAKESIDALYFASTTAPYWQRASSSVIAAACDLPDEIETVDFGGSLRSGTSALRAALNAVSAGAIRKAAVTVADVRESAPESLEEQQFGDGAAALMVGRENVIAELVAQTSRSDDFIDEWRRDRDRYVSVIGSRYSIERGYLANVVAMGKRILDLSGFKASDVSRVALNSPDGKAHLIAAKKLGFGPEQLVPVADTGLTGGPMALSLLCDALESAEQGALILSLNYGDGADAQIFRITGEKRRSKPSEPVGPGLQIPSYAVYRKLRDFTRVGPEEGAVVSNVMLEKENRQNVRLRATRCPKCETVQFPLTGVCVKCHNRSGLEEVQMARRGTIFTFTKDYLYNSPSQPTVMAVIELDDAARFYCQVTDADPENIDIGQRVELTLRRLKEGSGMHHYYWKCRQAM